MKIYYKILISVAILTFLKSAHAADRFTANYFYHQADSIAHSLLVEPYYLIILRSDSVDSDGKSEYWQYTFQNNDQHINMYFSTDSTSYETGPPWTGSSQIDNGWINSDSALALAEKDEGKEFRVKFPEHTIKANLGEDSALGKTEWEIVYKSSIFANIKLTYFINALTGLIRLKWNPPIVCYFPLTIGNKWSYYGIQTGDPAGPIQFNSVEYSVLIQGKTYFKDYSNFYRSDSIGHVYRYFNDKEMLWFDFTKAKGDSYFVTLDGIHYYKVTTTHRNTTVKNRAGKFTNCLSLYFDDPKVIDEEFEFYFAENVGIVKQNWSIDLYMELYEANVNGKQYPDTTSKVLESTSLPTDNRLFQNYPNPFNSSTTIAYSIDKPAQVQIVIFDASGRMVRILSDEFVYSGDHHLSWDGMHYNGGLAATGIYFCRIRIGKTTKTSKMLLLR